MDEKCETLTPPQLGRRWGTGVDKVHALIKSGELRAINLAVNPNGLPRYRIMLAEIERFEQARATKPPEKPRRRRRRNSAQPAIKEWF